MSNAQATLVFPYQLFTNHPAVTKGRRIFLIEEWLFFKQFNFHKQKLVLHRASMKCYEQRLRRSGHRVEYIAADEESSDVRKLIQSLAEAGVKEIHYAETVDDWLEERIRLSCDRYAIVRRQHQSPNFLLSHDRGQELVAEWKRFFMTKFYIAQRKEFRILLDRNGKPAGGQWSFDPKNRSRLPTSVIPPSPTFPATNKYVTEGRDYVQSKFASHYGSTDGLFGTPGGFYPITASDASDWLDDFLAHRFTHFGPYQDAIVRGESVLFHSVLTPMLNIGLLEPAVIIEKALSVSKQQKVPLNSLEGFIRQIIGWREFMRIVYEKAGRRQRTTNFWGFTRKIPKSFWTGTTGILPVDETIKKVLATGYAHHIERLMILGNFMLLCEFDPDDVYRWFMEMFVDAYDWVMVPNVYGMSQFSDGGLMSTKPYFSSSNYIMKMSDYPKGEWQTVWDALFWRFVSVHRTYCARNPRLLMLLRALENMPSSKRRHHLATAERYLATL